MPPTAEQRGPGRRRRAAGCQARHLVHSAAPGDIGAAAILRAGCRGGRRPQAPAIAADWLVAAQTGPTADLDAVCALAETLVDAGRLMEASTVANDGLARPPDRRRNSDHHVRLVLVAASVERLIGRHDAAGRRLKQALAGRIDGAVGRPGDGQPGAFRLRGRSFDEFGLWADRARGVAKQNLWCRRRSQHYWRSAIPSPGRAADSRVESDLAIAAIEHASDQDLAAHAELLAAVPWGLIAVERLPEALATGRRAAAAAARAGNGSATVALELGVVLALGLWVGSGTVWTARIEPSNRRGQQASIRQCSGHYGCAPGHCWSEGRSGPRMW